MISIHSTAIRITFSVIGIMALVFVYAHNNVNFFAQVQEQTLAEGSMCSISGENLNQAQERETFYIGCAAYLE